MNGKEDGVPIHNGILLNHTQKRNNSILSNMNGTRDYRTKQNNLKTNIRQYHLNVESKI